ncbi:MAG: hypothetical protein EZS28_010255 [Streblomastix strix]|uniref:Cyclin N-terminal domain-containing protein n=1 Tax=Streblomastix strix TaxID=222440 RepID=A0A5J4WHQ2_9EUKA|nr:MAG: hypothetical protein EZS28_010255 [Streblomastix strix]
MESSFLFNCEYTKEQNISAQKSVKHPKIDHSPAEEEEITEQCGLVELDTKIAPKLLIIKMTIDMYRGLKNKCEREINTEEENTTINKLITTLLHLVNELQLRSTEVMHASVLLSRVWRNKGRQITFQTLPMTTIGAFILANIYSDDFPIPIRVWGKILGVSAGKIHQWMMDMLDSLDFQLEVDREEFERISNEFSS